MKVDKIEIFVLKELGNIFLNIVEQRSFKLQKFKFSSITQLSLTIDTDFIALSEYLFQNDHDVTVPLDPLLVHPAVNVPVIDLPLAVPDVNVLVVDTPLADPDVNVPVIDPTLTHPAIDQGHPECPARSENSSESSSSQSSSMGSSKSSSSSERFGSFKSG